jgi:hypothetical protein
VSFQISSAIKLYFIIFSEYTNVNMQPNHQTANILGGLLHKRKLCRAGGIRKGHLKNVFRDVDDRGGHPG